MNLTKVICLHEDEVKELVKEEVREAVRLGIEEYTSQYGRRDEILSQYLTKQELADLLNCSVATIDRMKKEDKLPSYKIFGMVRFSKEEIREFLQGQKLKEGEL